VTSAHALVLLAAFAASVAFIFLKAFQQRNVTFDNYRWVMPTSLGMAVCEVYVVANIAKLGWHLPLVVVVGLGSGLGAVCAMYAHHRWVKHKPKQSFVVVDGRKIPVQQE